MKLIDIAGAVFKKLSSIPRYRPLMPSVRTMNMMAFAIEKLRNRLPPAAAARNAYQLRISHNRRIINKGMFMLAGIRKCNIACDIICKI